MFPWERITSNSRIYFLSQQWNEPFYDGLCYDTLSLFFDTKKSLKSEKFINLIAIFNDCF